MTIWFSIILAINSLLNCAQCGRFVAFDGKIGYVSDESMDFVSAQNFCNKSRAHLAVVTSTRGAARLSEIFQLNYWSGWLGTKPEDRLDVISKYYAEWVKEHPMATELRKQRERTFLEKCMWQLCALALVDEEIYSCNVRYSNKALCIMSEQEHGYFQELEELTIAMNHQMSDASFLQISFIELYMKETQLIRTMVIGAACAMVSFIVLFLAVVILVIGRMVKENVVCHMPH